MTYYPQVLKALMPGNVGSLPDLSLIPRPKPIDTRLAGSWVCPTLLTGGEQERERDSICMYYIRGIAEESSLCHM
jgi:hypothetical protein